MFSLGRT